MPFRETMLVLSCKYSINLVKSKPWVSCDRVLETQRLTSEADVADSLIIGEYNAELSKLERDTPLLIFGDIPPVVE